MNRRDDWVPVRMETRGERNTPERIQDPKPKGGAAAPGGGLSGNAPSNDVQDRHLHEIGIGKGGSHVPDNDDKGGGDKGGSTNQGTDEKGQGTRGVIEKGGGKGS